MLRGQVHPDVSNAAHPLQPQLGFLDVESKPTAGQIQIARELHAELPGSRQGKPMHQLETTLVGAHQFVKFHLPVTPYLLFKFGQPSDELRGTLVAGPSLQKRRRW